MDVTRERAEQQWLLRRAERSIDSATLAAIGSWLDAFRLALLQELGVPQALVAAASRKSHRRTMPAAVAHADFAVDAAVARTWGEWQNQLENQVLPTVSIAFGEAFQQTRRADPQGAFRFQQQYLAEVSDRLKIWPQGAFEDIRPELLEALSEAETVDQMTDRIGRVLTIDAKSRELRAQINEVEERLASPDLDPADRAELRAWRKDLWEQHDESLNEWQWKARRIARTESHGAVSAGQLAAAKIRQELTGIRMWKRWLSTEDSRTRASHRVADGQAVPLDQPFRVGGFLLDHPADAISVAPHEVINCRCTMLIYDDDELQDEFDEQGGKGPVEPGSVRIGPDDADRADEAIVQVAEREGRVKPKVGQRGEDAGQSMPAEPVGVEITDERTPVPAPDVETATEERLADYLIRTDEREDDELRALVEEELARRRDSDEIEVQFGEPEHADDVIEVDDDGDWLDDPRWASDDEDLPPVTDDDEPQWDDWQVDDDDLPGDVVPADPPEIVENIGSQDLDDVQAEFERVLDEFAEACDSGDDDRINDALAKLDAAEARLNEATQAAEVDLDDDDDHDLEPDGDGLEDSADSYDPDDPESVPPGYETIAEIFGVKAAREDYERDQASRPGMTAADRRRYELMDQADAKAEAEGIEYEQALAELQGLDLDQLRRREFVANAKLQGLSSTNFADLLDELHRRLAFDWLLMAEDATRGHMLSRRTQAVGGFDESMLWRVNDQTARRHMSPEMAEWFDEHGRITKADLERMIEAGLDVFDAEGALGEWARWSGRRFGEDYLR
ncbi:MuF-like minor capsid protein [Gordonia phage Dexdert]|uniref:MuF-like minor capsid protein n=1 Tax=Gordonia phage Dexdert TaxID=2794946 RepID=A0A7T1KS71_9CAUD|nr:head morphogenesis [Gordonia phage Dexdert]QPO17013.1 MuF-like minor capsid protein [Gordonia phage Dexdert]